MGPFGGPSVIASSRRRAREFRAGTTDSLPWTFQAPAIPGPGHIAGSLVAQAGNPSRGRRPATAKTSGCCRGLSSGFRVVVTRGGPSGYEIVRVPGLTVPADRAGHVVEQTALPRAGVGGLQHPQPRHREGLVGHPLRLAPAVEQQATEEPSQHSSRNARRPRESGR